MRTFIVLALLTAAVAAEARVYTWTDANGVVHYTDRAIGPTDAAVVKGVETARPEEAPPEEEVKVNETALQGIWCEYEVAPDKASSAVEPAQIEWAFSGSTLTHRDIKSGRVTESQFTLQGVRIVGDKAALGSRTIRRFKDDQMELGDDNAYRRLRRGSC